MYNEKPINRKTEVRALNAIRYIIDEHPTMEACFNEQDKMLSWDGFIRIYKDDNSSNDKANFDDDIPVQIKGHFDERNQFMNKNLAYLSVDLDDLNAFFRREGCLYFHVFINKDSSETRIFYSSLYPSKIKAFLETAVLKDNKSSITIPFILLEKDCKILHSLCKQFSFEARMQGFGKGQIVEKTITDKNFQSIKFVTATTFGVKTLTELIRKINLGDVVIYGTIDDSGIKYPIQTNKKIVSIKRLIESPLSIGTKQYYSSYELGASINKSNEKDYFSSGSTTIRPSRNILITVKGSEIKVGFDPVTDYMQLRKDAEFLIDLANKKEFTISGKKFSFSNFNINENQLAQFRQIIEEEKILEDIGITIQTPFKELTNDGLNQIKLLNAIKTGQVSFYESNKVLVYMWTFRGKDWPVVIDRSKNKINLYGLVFNSNLRLFLSKTTSEDDKDTLQDGGFLIPNFIYLKPKQLSNLYSYNYESMYEQINRTVINEETIEVLNTLALNLISAFDISNNERLLDVAEAILNRLIGIFQTDVYLLVNKSQIEIRKDGVLSEESSIKLEKIAEKIISPFNDSDYPINTISSNLFLYCYQVLKGEIEKADSFFNELTEVEKKAVENFPIRELHLKLKAKHQIKV